MYKIYKISFEDGFAYVGMTKFPVEDRIRRHINNPDNAELSRRLTSEVYVAEVLYENIPTFEIATQIESDEIFALEKPINISGVNPNAKTVHFGHKITKRNSRKKPKRQRQIEPRPGDYRCSMCCQVKPHTDFYKDRTRFNGLHSRCKPCKNKIHKELWNDSEYRKKQIASQRKYCNSEKYKERQKQIKAERVESGVPAYLKHLRIQAGLSQEKLAERLGCTPGWISALETGARPLPIAYREAYQKEFGMNMDIAAFLKGGNLLYDFK